MLVCVACLVAGRVLCWCFGFGVWVVSLIYLVWFIVLLMVSVGGFCVVLV